MFKTSWNDYAKGAALFYNHGRPDANLVAVDSGPNGTGHADYCARCWRVEHTLTACVVIW